MCQSRFGWGQKSWLVGHQGLTAPKQWYVLGASWSGSHSQQEMVQLLKYKACSDTVVMVQVLNDILLADYGIEEVVG